LLQLFTEDSTRFVYKIGKCTNMETARNLNHYDKFLLFKIMCKL